MAYLYSTSFTKSPFPLFTPVLPLPLQSTILILIHLFASLDGSFTKVPISNSDALGPVRIPSCLSFDLWSFPPSSLPPSPSVVPLTSPHDFHKNCRCVHPHLLHHCHVFCVLTHPWFQLWIFWFLHCHDSSDSLSFSLLQSPILCSTLWILNFSCLPSSSHGQTDCTWVSGTDFWRSDCTTRG